MATTNSSDSSTPAELAAPYGSGPAAFAAAAPGTVPVKVPVKVPGTLPGCGCVPEPVARIRTHHLHQAKVRGEHFAMLTAYDQYNAEIFTKPASRCS